MVKIICRANEGRYTLQAEGHSGFAPLGSDIVCASISAIVQTLYAGLGEYCKAEGECKARSGYLYMSVRVPLRYEREAAAVFLTGVQGLKLIAEEYPNCLVIDVGGKLKTNQI